MPNCSVAFGCNNTSKQEGISVFHFPKDEKLRKKWIEQVKRTRDKWSGPTAHSVVCSDHFSEDSFQDECKLSLSFGIRKGKWLLKSSAVPTIFKRKASTNHNHEPALKRTFSFEKRERQRVGISDHYNIHALYKRDLY